MNGMKKLFFYAGNVVIGAFTFYTYLYLWAVMSWGKPMQLLSKETLLTLLVFVFTFLGYNYFLLRKETATIRYWTSGLTVALLIIVIIVLILTIW